MCALLPSICIVYACVCVCASIRAPKTPTTNNHQSLCTGLGADMKNVNHFNDDGTTKKNDSHTNTLTTEGVKKINCLCVCVCMLWLHCHCWWRCMRTIENDYQHGLLPSLVDLCVCECVFCMKNWNYKSDRTIVPLERQTEIASTVLGDYFSISNRQWPTYHY